MGKFRERAALVWLLLGHAALVVRLWLRSITHRPVAPWNGSRPLRVLFLSAYPPTHYGTVSRHSRWTPHLEKRGCVVTVLCPSTEEEFAGFGRGDVAADMRYLRAALRSRSRDLDQVDKHDVLVLHRALLPFSHWMRPTLERLMARLNPRVVYDFFDSIWVLRQKTHAASRSALARWLNPPDTVEEICRLARVVTVSSEYLAQVPRSIGADVRVVPMMLEPDEYRIKEHARSETVVLGWMGHRGNLRQLRTLEPALRRVARERRILLRVVAPDAIHMEGVPLACSSHPWSPETERRDLLSFDIGLLPLVDDEQTRGKSPLKLLQYSAAGLPIVASPVAIDQRVFVDGEAILFATNEDEWVAALLRLVDDVALRSRLGAAARRALEANYSFAAHASDYHGLLCAVARGS